MPQFRLLRVDRTARFSPGRIHKRVRRKFSPERGAYLAVVRRKVAEAEAAGVVLK